MMKVQRRGCYNSVRASDSEFRGKIRICRYVRTPCCKDPVKPSKLVEMDKVFGSVSLVDNKGSSVSASSLNETKVVGLYFSAHWCPPCRGFTPVLAQSYQTIVKAGKSFQIVFISSDRSDADFKEYFKEMPWLALPFSERDLKGSLSGKYGVNGIPSLILLDGATGEIITKDGRSVIMQDQSGNDFPWAGSAQSGSGCILA